MGRVKNGTFELRGYGLLVVDPSPGVQHFVHVDGDWLTVRSMARAEEM